MIAKNQQNRNRILVVLTAYMLVMCVELLINDFHYYYFNLVVVGFLTVLLCCRKPDNVLKCYAVIVSVCMAMYSLMLTGAYNIADYLMYSAPINLHDIVMAFELAILTISGGQIVISRFMRFIDNINSGVHYNAYSKTESKGE